MKKVLAVIGAIYLVWFLIWAVTDAPGPWGLK